MKLRGLSPKQQRFVDEYLVDSNATQAAVRAGYSKRNADKIGSELLGKTRVAEAVKERQQKISAELGTSAHWVRENLRRVVELGLRLEPTMVGGLPVATLNLPAANKALELLGKDHGMFKEGVNLNLNMQNAQTEQLLALLPQALAVLGRGNK